jgi:DNA-binding PadR family transcriptional regulator
MGNVENGARKRKVFSYNNAGSEEYRRNLAEKEDMLLQRTREC